MQDEIASLKYKLEQLSNMQGKGASSHMAAGSAQAAKLRKSDSLTELPADLSELDLDSDLSRENSKTLRWASICRIE